MPVMATSVARAVSFSILDCAEKKTVIPIDSRNLLGIEKRAFRKTKFSRVDCSPLRERRQIRIRGAAGGQMRDQRIRRQKRRGGIFRRRPFLEIDRLRQAMVARALCAGLTSMAGI